MGNIRLGTGQSIGIPAHGLNDLFYIQAPAFDNDPIPLWIGNQKWDTGTNARNNDKKNPNPHGNSVGVYATPSWMTDWFDNDFAGQREIDTGFAC